MVQRYHHRYVLIEYQPKIYAKPVIVTGFFLIKLAERVRLLPELSMKSG